MNKHNFINVTKFNYLELGLVKEDKICLNCGFILNKYNCLVDFNTYEDFYFDTKIHVNDYLNCEEILIKRLLE